VKSERHPFRVVFVKPSKYNRQGQVERFRKGFMPNSTLLHLKSMTPSEADGCPVVIETIDEYTQVDLRYLELLRPESCSLLALVGVQSHQMHRALDLAALARANGVSQCIVGGPHVMTCETTELQNRGVSFALAEAELVWEEILRDAISDELRPIYGGGQRWQNELKSPVLVPPTRSELGRYIIPMVGVYPARGCPFSCNFCSVVKIAGKKVRSQPVETTVRTLIAAREAGVRVVMFTSDNLNKYSEVRSLLKALIDERVRLPFFAQCDVQLGRDEELVELLARAGCAQVFVGVESFSRATLKAVRKFQNDPAKYADLVRICHRHGVSTHFSNILGFPDQDEAAILQHIRELRAIGPFMASFYILTPIPGTDQYDDFRAAELIWEPNLDRFDATCSVWRHPHLDARQLERLLMRAYRDFYSPRDVLKKMFGHRWNAPWFVHELGLGYAAFARFAAWRGMHPMAGGLGIVHRDKAADYLHLRKKVFGLERLSLPSSLTLTHAADRRLDQPAVLAT
jgi:pyruvate-formate lyase-activating enzyme